MHDKDQQKSSTDHESVPMVPDLDFLMAMAFRENSESDPVNPEKIS